jgi:hypothetical protein
MPEERNEVKRIERKLAVTMKRFKVTAVATKMAPAQA